MVHPIPGLGLDAYFIQGVPQYYTLIHTYILGIGLGLDNNWVKEVFDLCAGGGRWVGGGPQDFKCLALSPLDYLDFRLFDQARAWQ